MIGLAVGHSGTVDTNAHVKAGRRQRMLLHDSGSAVMVDWVYKS